MDKKTRNIIIGVTSAILIILIIVIVCVVVGNSNKEVKIENEPEIENNISENEDPEQNSNIEEDIEEDIQNEDTEEEIKNEVSNNIKNNQQIQQNNQTSQNQIIGREEQESIPEDEGPTDEEKVIELVKKQWGSKDSTVSYNIANHEGNIYMVSVNSKETTEVKAWYQVDLATGETTQL